MKNFTQHKTLGNKYPTLFLCLFFLILIQETQAQYISNNGAYISTTEGTFIEMDTINNINTATFKNNGTVIFSKFNNNATLENNGTLTLTTVDNTATLENNGTLTVTTVNNTATLENNGTLTTSTLDNTATVENNGTLTTATLDNTGTLDNNGTLTTSTLENIATLENSGTITIFTFNNDGNTTGDGTYNITGEFSSSGTFFSEAGTVNMNGTSSQIMDMEASTFYNLTINNAESVTLNSTQTVITNNLTINSEKIFILEADKNLTVTGTIDNYGGTAGFILKSNDLGTASLIHNSIDVPATFQRYITGVAEDWHFLSAPVSNQSISGGWTPSGTYGNGTGYDLYIFNEPTPCWTYQLNVTVAPTWPSIHPSANFVKGRGYLYATQASNPTKEFIGLLNNGTITYPITNESPDLVVKGFNFIGNPYPSSIDWTSETGWVRTNLVPSGGGYDMWIWNQESNNYGVLNSIVGVGTNGVSQYIAPTQGYFVRASSNGTIGISNATRVNNGASNWLRPIESNVNTLKARITSNDGHGYDEVLLQYGYPENQAGALKLFSQNEAAPSAYLYDLNKDLSVRYLTDTNENSKVPLHFKAGVDGGYSLGIDAEIYSFDILLLEDKKTNTLFDLKTNLNYEFNASTSDTADRFILHFKTITIEDENFPVAIYYDGSQINVDLTLVAGQTDIKIYDMLGRLLADKVGAGETIHRFNINPKSAIYIVIVQNNEKLKSSLVLAY
jgi:hypothetical protein